MNFENQKIKTYWKIDGDVIMENFRINRLEVGKIIIYFNEFVIERKWNFLLEKISTTYDETLSSL